MTGFDNNNRHSLWGFNPPLKLVPRQPWKKCPSTHCERREECTSPSECIVKSENEK